MASPKHSIERSAKILVVEDEVPDARNFIRLLKSLGYPIVINTASGEDAVEIARATSPDLLLVDMDLAVEWDSIEAVRKIQSFCGAAVVYVIGMAEDPDLFERAENTKSYGYLRKPVSELELKDAVASALRRKSEDPERRVAERSAETMAGQVGSNIARMRAEAELRDSKEQIRLIADALPVLIAYVDSNLRYRFHNKAYEEWYRKSAEEIDGKDIRDVVGDNLYKLIHPHAIRALSGETARFEPTAVFPDGKTRHTSALIVPHMNDEGEVKGVATLVTAHVPHRSAHGGGNFFLPFFDFVWPGVPRGVTNASGSTSRISR